MCAFVPVSSLITVVVCLFFSSGWICCSLFRLLAVSIHMEELSHSWKYLCSGSYSSGIKQVKFSSFSFSLCTLLYLLWDQWRNFFHPCSLKFKLLFQYSTTFLVNFRGKKFQQLFSSIYICNLFHYVLFCLDFQLVQLLYVYHSCFHFLQIHY